MTLQITNTIVNKEGHLIDSGITYEVHYVIANNELTTVQCSVSKMAEGNLIPIGYIRRENDRVNTDFQDGADMQGFLSKFSLILQEIESELSGSAVEIKKK